VSGRSIGTGIGLIAGFALGVASGGTLSPFLAASLFGVAGGIIGGLVDPIQLDDVIGPQITDDIDLTTIAEGNPIVWVWGAGPVTWKVTWSTGLRETEHVTTEGGKGGPEQTTREFTYDFDGTGILCKGPAELLKILREGELIYDRTDNAGPVRNTDFLPLETSFRFDNGGPDQLPDPLEQADKGVAATPGQRNICRLAFIEHDVTDIGRMPTFQAIVATGTLTPTYPITTLTLSHAVQKDVACLIAPDGVSLLIGLHDVNASIIDLATLSIVYTRTWQEVPTSGYKGGDFDLLGNYYGTTTENILAINGSVVKFSGENLARLAKTELNSLAPNGKILGSGLAVRVIGTTVGAQKVVVGGRFKWIYVVDTGIATERDNEIFTLEGYNQLNILREIDVDALVGGTSSHSVYDLTVDAFGDCWAIAEDSDPAPNTVTFVRMDGESGAVEEVFTGIAIENMAVTGSLSYDEITHSLLIHTGGFEFFRWAINSETLFGPLLWMPESFAITELDVVNLVKLRTLADTLWAGNSTGGIFDPVNEAFIKNTSGGGSINHEWRFLNRVTGGETTLDVVFDEVSTSQEVGLAAAQVDVTELATVPVKFLKADNRGPARSFLEHVSRGHLVRQRPLTSGANWGIEFILRGQSSTFAITADKLGATPNELRERIQEVFKDPRLLPQRFDVEFLDPDKDYERQFEPSTRAPEVVTSRRVDSYTYPGALDHDGARQMGEKLLYAGYEESDEAVINVTPEFLEIDPGDVGTVTEGGVVRTQEVVKWLLGADWIINLELHDNDDEAFTSTATGQSRSTPQVITLAGASKIYIVDGPAPNEAFGDRLARQIFVGPSGSGTYKGGFVEVSPNGTDGWLVEVKILASQAAVYGTLTATLPPGPTTTVDNTNTLSVRLTNGSLSTITELQMLSDDEINPFYVLGEDGWEYGQYATVTPQANDVLDLTVLRRGRRNTENYMEGHTEGMPVIFPTAASTIIVSFSADDINVTTPEKIYYRAVEFNGTARLIKEHEIIGRSKRPYSPTAINGSIAADVWTVTGVRRSRDGKSLPLSGVPVGENIHEYQVDVLASPGGPDATVLATYNRTVTANGSIISAVTDGFSFTYDDLDQTTDYGSPQTTIYLAVYQMSDLVLDGTGEADFRGEPAYATLNG
jgi:hypothetical protein